MIICFTQYTFYCLFKTTCPGSLLHDFPRGDFCRLIALSDGTVVNQEAVTETLCLEPSIKYTKGRIGQDFLDTNSRKLSRLLFNARCLAKLLLLWYLVSTMICYERNKICNNILLVIIGLPYVYQMIDNIF